MRISIVLAAIALAGCQAADTGAKKTVEEKPMGVGALQDREFAMPLLGVAQTKANGNEAVLRFDPIAKIIYFGTRVNGKVKEDTMPYAAPELVSTAGRVVTDKYLIQVGRLDCESDRKDIGKSTIIATVSPKATPETMYTFCMVSNWPKDARKPGWSSKPF